jgi:ABC-type amino acid transport substrate-binding protein
MIKLYKGAGILLLIGFFFVTGCSLFGIHNGEKKPRQGLLRVGITPNYPPLIFKEDKEYIGAEINFAKRLGETLKLEVDFLELGWEQLIPALFTGKIDIIMSGMSITDARKIRINFTEPYLQIGLLAAMRSGDASRYTSIQDILSTSSMVGVMENTTGDAFVQKNLPKANRLVFVKISDAVFALKQKKIDLFIHDAPAIAWTVSENEASLQALWEFLNREHLAWGVRYDDEEFLDTINKILKRWKTDGTLDRELVRWLPYLRRIK